MERIHIHHAGAALHILCISSNEIGFKNKIRLQNKNGWIKVDLINFFNIVFVITLCNFN